MRPTLPSFAFEAGLGLRRLVPSPLGDGYPPRDVWHWWAIGRLDNGEPFLVTHTGPVGWDSPAHLGDGLRKKILGRLRTDVRHATAPPAGFACHDLRAVDRQGLEVGRVAAGALVEAFRRDVWRARFLQDHDTDYVILNVPFAEKDAAKAAGAQWDPAQRTWKINATKANPDAFERWLPPERPVSKGPGLG